MYSSLRAIVPNETSFSYSNNSAPPKKNEISRSINGGHGVYSSILSEKTDKRRKQLGNKGELLIYNLLCNEYGKESIIELSEAFVDLGIIQRGQEARKPFDISYKVNNTIRFVEVKSGSSNSFFISKGELQFAKENSEYYDLYIVNGLDKDKPSFIKMPQNFWDDERINVEGIIEDYEVSF